eukprot:CAMPEP_0180134492 /NCGR_PEP_ID=MMETSP0986-20121125/10198_1 /TAXON_ID=697907 /ORGANISM="non described non described, Strain CCMP2293" /LENGTH=270 /DNA_ID=CAMNT_0022074871 /DNA_START=16 /DNA_END=828 /DNA_ORIENTATION=+
MPLLLRPALLLVFLTTVSSSSQLALPALRAYAGITETIKHSPAFATLTVQMEPGQLVHAEPGAMIMMKGCTYKTQLAGPRERGDEATVGCFPSFSRAVLGGESLFVNVYESDPVTGGWVTLAAGCAGEIVVTDVDADRELFVTPGAFLGCRSNVQTDAKWKGIKGLFAGEGLFFLRAFTNNDLPGKLYMAASGAIEEMKVEVGEELIVDSGHVLAFEDTLTYRLTGQASIKSFFMGGEGVVCLFTVRDRGPRTQAGRVWVQTHQPVRVRA